MLTVIFVFDFTGRKPSLPVGGLRSVGPTMGKGRLVEANVLFGLIP